MFYKVMKKYQRGPSIDVAAFVEIADAKAFIKIKMIEDIRLKVNVVYQLSEAGEVIEEFTQDSITMDEAGGASAGQQRSSGSTFNPTPLNTAPRPPGVPHHWLNDDEDEKK